MSEITGTEIREYSTETTCFFMPDQKRDNVGGAEPAGLVDRPCFVLRKLPCNQYSFMV